MGLFITVECDPAQLSAAQRQQLVQLCPVEIFALADDQIVVRPEQEDECTLCRLCLDAMPPGALRIRKHYNGETLSASVPG